MNTRKMTTRFFIFGTISLIFGIITKDYAFGDILVVIGIGLLLIWLSMLINLKRKSKGKN